eukprot:1157574-Pelagomonas_calceolata.AAC.7
MKSGGKGLQCTFSRARMHQHACMQHESQTSGAVCAQHPEKGMLSTACFVQQGMHAPACTHAIPGGKQVWQYVMANLSGSVQRKQVMTAWAKLACSMGWQIRVAAGSCKHVVPAWAKQCHHWYNRPCMLAGQPCMANKKRCCGRELWRACPSAWQAG